MKFSFATSAALFVLFAAASCSLARGGLQHACEDVRSRSLELLHIVRSIIAQNGSKDEADVSTSLSWMEAKDRCDPSSLRDRSEQCIEKILSVLKSYSAVVEQLIGFERCSEFAYRVKPVMEMLLKNISMCVGIDDVKEFHNSKEKPQALDQWKKTLLCNYTMNRLYSFSILTARVFAVGDPAHHGSSQSRQCSTVD